MNITEEVYRELAKLSLSGDSHIYLQEIRNKDGIYLFRGWVQESLNAVYNGKLERAFKKILDLR